ncbi:hypothetical protein G7054_g12421 [Neopestalotiopsis clavispora]|nr:hypothetical protein G7054_g12421 [Neopestalotiopsis clavispora]
MGGAHNVATLLPVLPSPVSSGVNDTMNISPLSHKGLSLAEITPFKLDVLPEDDHDGNMMLQTSIASICKPDHSYRTKERLVLRSFSSTCTEATTLENRLDVDTDLAAFESRLKTTLPLAQSLPWFLASNSSPGGPKYFRRNPQFASLSAIRELRNSSLSTHSRRRSNTFQRSWRQCRRSLSMFENHVDVVKPKTIDDPVPQGALQSVMDPKDVQNPVLAHFYPDGENAPIPRISQETFLDVLKGRFEDQYTRRIVIDCRFEYEYEGGHIDGAINYYDKDLLMGHLFEPPMEVKVLLILHCEYSAHRAPMMARYIRSKDRAINAEYYPTLSYPEIYILDGGYREFFIQHRQRCRPQSYVEMNDEKHVATCEREMSKLQRHRKGLGRVKTFTFGPCESLYEASPTVSGQNSSRDGKSFNPGVGRSLNRRAASY